MTQPQREPEPRPTGETRSPETVAPGDRDLPWKATAERRDLWGPRPAPLEGTVHGPTGHDLARSRPSRTRRVLRALLAGGAVTVLGVGLGLGALLVTGSLGVLPVLGVLGLGAVAGAATTGVTAARSPRENGAAARLPSPATDGPAGTRTTLESVLAADDRSRSRVQELRTATSDPDAALALDHAAALLRRLDGLAGSAALAARRPSDGDVMLLEGMATRYVPELLDSLAAVLEHLGTFAGSAREQAKQNLRDVDRQLGVLGEALEGVESDVSAGVTRSLAVHSEFLRQRFADQDLDPSIDL